MLSKTVKSVLNKKKNRDNWFLDDYTLNPYEGCGFNCQYCYIRGSKYGENLSEKLAVKTNVLDVLERQLKLRVKKNQYGIIALASATDPYQKAEQQYKLTQGCLHTILRHKFPVLVITKSDLILRDIEILKQIDQEAIHAPDVASRLSRGAIISFSVSTLDDRVAAVLEPGAPSPQKRLETLKRCKDAGLFVGVSGIPVLPFISDTREHLEHLVSAAKEAGADFILMGGLTLFGHHAWDSKTLYYRFLDRHFPHLVSSYDALYRGYFMPSKKYLDSVQQLARDVCREQQIRNTLV